MEIEREIRSLANPAKALVSQSFFKTYEGGYAEGDKFLGLTAPVQRAVAQKYIGLSFAELNKLLHSGIHEFRSTALEILDFQYERADEKGQKKIVDFYLKNKARVNNWDLVDASAPYILGDWLKDKDRAILYKLIRSKNIWERRIAVVSTYALIKRGDFKDILKLSELSLEDRHDLMHKACGWMLREVGKKSEKILVRFLDKNATKMPRTMMRYSIERFSPEVRKHYLMLK